MAATVSVSKGVFAFKRQTSESSQQSAKKKRRSIKNVSSSSYWPTNSETTSALQQENYQLAWTAISGKLQSLETELHQSIFDDLVSFIGSSHNTKGANSDSSSTGIPTAILVTGVNMPDSREILTRLNEQVFEKQAASHIVRLNSRSCSSLKNCIVNLVSEIVNPRETMNESSEGDSDSSSDEDECLDKSNNKSPKKSSKVTVKKSNCTMLALEAFHQEQLSLGKGGNIGIIFEDVECFTSAQLLMDFIQICSDHPRLPLVLVMCVATSPAALHRILPKPTLARLSLTTFQARPSHHYLTSLIDQVLMDGSVSSFRLGGKALKSLLDMFLYHHLSVNSFVQGLKYCALDHFLSEPGSLLCCPTNLRQKRLKNATHEHLEAIRKLPSFRQHVEGLPNKEKAPLLLNDNKLKEEVLSLLSSLDGHYERLCCVVRALHSLTATIPNAPLGRQVWSLMSLSLNHRLGPGSTEMEEVWTAVGEWGRLELVASLLAIVTGLNASQDDALLAVADSLQELMTKLLDMDEGQNCGAEENELSPSKKSMPSPVKQLKATDRFQLKEKLLELAAKKKLNSNKPNRYQNIRAEIIAVLKDLVKEHLAPPTSKPLHEICFYNNSSELINRLIGHHRAAITKALIDPSFYLQCSCCSAGADGGLSPSLPDLSVVYRLHLECGRLINLYDWMQAFFAVAEGRGEGGDEEKSDKSEEKAKLLQTRFVRAVSELQFLGFIKTSKQKTDHVARLTWGNF